MYDIMQKMPAFVWTTRVRFVDTDASQRIHYTALFRFFEAAEQEFLRELGLVYSGLADREAGWPRVHAECDISGALVYDDEITIEVSVNRVGTSSFELAFRAMKARAGARPAPPIVQEHAAAPTIGSKASVARAYSLKEAAEECAKGKVVIVCMNAATQRAQPLPAAFAESLRGRQ